MPTRASLESDRRLLADARGNGDNDDGDRGFTGVEKNIDCVERVRKRTGTDTDEYNFVTNRTEIHRFRVSSTPFVSFPRKNSRRTILIDPETISRTESANCSKFSGSQEEGTSAGIRGGWEIGIYDLPSRIPLVFPAQRLGLAGPTR